MTEPSGGGSVQVVEPGSKDDVFSTKNVQPDPAATQPDPNQSQPDDTGGDGGFTADDDSKLLSKLEEQIQARVAKAHSGLDKRNDQLQKRLDEITQDLETQRQTAKEAERRARVEGLSDEEKAAHQARWNVEDEKVLLKKQQAAVDEYLRQTKAYDLVVRYGRYGLEPEHLEDAESVDEMDLIAEKIRGDFLETGKKPVDKETPAGSKGPSDLGGAPPGAEPFKLGTEQGVAGMAANIKGLFKQPGNK